MLHVGRIPESFEFLETICGTVSSVLDRTRNYICRVGLTQKSESSSREELFVHRVSARALPSATLILPVQHQKSGRHYHAMVLSAPGRRAMPEKVDEFLLTARKE